MPPESPSRPRFARSPALAGLLLLAVAPMGCGGGDGPTPPPSTEARVARLEPARTIPTRLFAGDSLPAMRVRAVDAEGAPVAGATVAFRSSGQSHIARAAVVTDSGGYALAGTWRMSRRTGVDTLIASVADGPTLVLTVPMVAGPVYELELVQRPASGTVGAPLLLVLRGRDQHHNPTAGVPITFTVAAGVNPRPAETPPAAMLDDSGYVLVDGWIPRILGTHTLTATVRDVFAEQLVVTQLVTSPACAPYASLAPTATDPPHTGSLGINLSAPCADSVDRWIVRIDSASYLRLATTGAPVRVQRAGAIGEATLVMPMRPPGTVPLLLTAGDYEVIMGPRRPTDGTGYGVVLRQTGVGSVPGPTCDTAWVVRGAALRHGTSCAVDRPEASLPAGSTASAFGVVAASLPGRELRVSVTAIPVVGTQLRRVVAIYARRRGSDERQLLATLPNTATERTLAVTIPPGWDDAIVLIGHRAGENGAFDVEFR